MRSTTALRLLGCLNTAAPSAHDVAEAVRQLQRMLGRQPSGILSRELERVIDQCLRARGHAGTALTDTSDVDAGAGVVAGRAGGALGSQGAMLVVDLASFEGPPTRLGQTPLLPSGEFYLELPLNGSPVVRISVVQGDEILLTSPPQSLQEQTWLEWSADTGRAPAPTEFEVRQALFDGVLRSSGKLLSDLGSSSAGDEVELLSQLSGCDAELTRAHVEAAKVARELDIPTAAAFALRELGRTSDVLLQCSPRALVDSLERSVAERKVPADLSASLPQVSRVLAARHLQAFLATRPGSSSWQDVLAAVGIDAANAGVLARLFTENARPSLDDVRREVRDTDASALHEQLLLARALSFHAPAIRAVRSRDVRSTSALAELSEAVLDQLLEPAEPDTALRRGVIEAAMKHSDVAHAGVSLLRRRREHLQASTRDFVARHAGPLDLRTAHIERIAANADATARTELSAMQRIVRISQNARVAEALLSLGYGSAQQIALLAADAFVQHTSAALSAKEARRVHVAARNQYKATLELYLRHNKRAAGPTPAALADVEADANLSSLPTFEFLFGSQDQCLCEECNSVLSPAAYLVDLLLWLQSAPTTGTTALKVLLDRRPDVAKILLDCKNTTTEVPYIDLVCELLEDELALRAGLLTKEQRLKLVRQRQTRLSRSEIRAYPEYVNDDVYRLLSASSVAPSLPFDLWLREIRAHLHELGAPRAQLLRAFLEPTQAATESALDAEALSASPIELRLISDPKPAASAQQAIWGISLQEPVSLEALLRRAPPNAATGEPLSYDDLTLALATRFVDPERKLVVALREGAPASSCDLADRILTGVSAAALDRLHRFLRLASHVRISIAELDLLLAAAGTPRVPPVATEPPFLLDQAALTRLRGYLELAAALGLALEDACYLFQDFPKDAAALRTTGNGPSLYARLFLSRADNEPIGAAFTDPEAAATPLPSLQSEQPRLSSALQISAGELDVLLQQTELSQPGNNGVSPRSLSLLYRYSRLARSLSLPAAELTALIRELGATPFADPQRLLAFVRDVKLLQAAQLTAHDVKAFGASQPALDTSDVSLQLELLRERVARSLLEASSSGSAPSPEQVLAAIGDKWLPIVAAWAGVDLRRAAILRRFAELEAGYVPALFTAATRPLALQKALRARRLLEILTWPGVKPSDVPRIPGCLELLQQPSWPALKALLQLTEVTRAAPRPSAFLDYLELTLDAATTRVQLRDALSGSFGCLPSTIEQLWDERFGAGQVQRAELLRAEHYRLLGARHELTARLKVDAATLARWAASAPNDAQARDVRRAFRATLAHDSWLAQSAKIQDALRTSKRNALTDYLLATAQAGQPKTKNDMYGQLLIDVEMGDCRTTSRVVQATSAVQLFVQRAFLLLEGVIQNAGHLHWREWDWRKRYQLWAANRTIFLYPENFIDPARRATSSQLFDDLLKRVRQHEITDENVGTAYEGYLAGLEEIANLDYAAIAYDPPDAQGRFSNTQMGVVARTRGTAPRHFYRQLWGGVWSAWEEIAIGVQSSHLELAQINGKAWLAWPSLTDYADPVQTVPSVNEVQKQATAGVPGVNVNAFAPRALTYARFNWTMRDARGTWTAPRATSRAFVFAQRPPRSILMDLTRQHTDPPEGFTMGLYLPSPGAQGVGREVATLGAMAIARDTTSTFQNKAMTAVSATAGEHQYELQRIDLLDASTSKFEPWPNLVFDENRQVALVNKQALQVFVPGATSGTPVPKVVMTPPTTYVVTADPWFMRRPKADAFVVTTSETSALCLSSPLRETLLAAPKPAKTFSILPMYHPFASELRELLRSAGLTGLLAPDVQNKAVGLRRSPRKYADLYALTAGEVETVFAEEGIDFQHSAPYGLYNYELFFHAPLAIADTLRNNLQFEQAQRYLHFIFNPFSTGPIDPAKPRAHFWTTKPFRQRAVREEDEDISAILIKGATSGQNPFIVNNTRPFDADAVAQNRPLAYQKLAVTRYIENLVAWGDSLYRLGQPEDINESTQLYLLADALLGERPTSVRQLGTKRALAFEDVSWAGEANILVALENLVALPSPTDGHPAPGHADADAEADADESAERALPLVHLPLVRTSLQSDAGADAADAPTGQVLYFCVPPNQKMLALWDTVASRLSQIRQCRTIDGVFAPPPLTAQRIDPQALATAAAAGITVADAVASLFTKPPPYRFRVMVSKAQEYCAEAKALGAAVLATLEKRDAEALARLRANHESALFTATLGTKLLQKEVAQHEVQTLDAQITTVTARRDHFRNQRFMIQLEEAAFGLSAAATVLDTAGLVFDVLSGALYLIPGVNLGISGFGGTPHAGATFSSENAGSSSRQAAQGLSKLAGILDRAASLTSTQASYVRRQEEWTHQANQAELELAQLAKQRATAQLRIGIADAELLQHGLQAASLAATDALLREKFTNTELYEAHLARLVELYRESYEQAQTMTAYARACYRFETGAEPPAGSKDHWLSLHHGLLTGERLARDIRELETAWLTRRPPAHVIVQHISLSQVAPRALLNLKTQGGSGPVKIPGWWFQRLYPSLTRRRLRSLAVSIPCVTGPFASVNAVVELTGQASLPQTKIHLSSGVRDNATDGAQATDRYVPFEGASLDGDTDWVIGFPGPPGKPVTDVDLNSISDVVLHFEYSAESAENVSLQGPPTALVLQDVRQLGDAWATLLAKHSVTIEVTPLLPTFFADYSLKGVNGALIALANGVDVGSKLKASHANNALTISAEQPDTFPWTELEHVYFIVELKQP